MNGLLAEDWDIQETHTVHLDTTDEKWDFVQPNLQLSFLCGLSKTKKFISKRRAASREAKDPRWRIILLLSHLQRPRPSSIDHI